MVQPTPALHQARDYLRTRLASRVWSRGDRLPTLERLAQSAGVSRATMWKVVLELRREGLVHTRRGSGITAGRPAEQPLASPQPLPRAWERVRGQLEHDVLTGAFQPGDRTPLVKELCERYGADYRTVRKSVTALCRAGVLAPHRRTMRIVGPVHGPSESAVLLVTRYRLRELRPSDFLPISPHAFVRALEAECSRRNLRLRCMSLADGQAGIARYLRERPVLGCILHRVAPGPVVDTLVARSLPGMVLDNIETFVFADLPVFARSRTLQCFRMDSAGAAEDVGRFLLRSGYRRVAYVSPFHVHGFSLDRLAGLRRAFDSARFAGAVVPVTLDVSKRRLYQSALERLRRDGVRDMPADLMRPAEDASPLAESSQRFEERLTEYLRGQPARLAMVNATADAALVREMAPALDQALADPSIEAWVCANDQAGLAALAYLAKRRIPVPERLSVVGFDNSDEALYAELTSYDFDAPGIARAMLDRIAAPRFGPSDRDPSARVVMLRGMVIARGTTRTVKASGPAGSPRADGMERPSSVAVLLRRMDG